MASWRRQALRALVSMEERFDLLKYRVRERLGGRPPIEIVAYRGYGTLDRLCLRGRVQEARGIGPATEADSVYRNLLNMYRRLKTNEIPYARVRARFGKVEQEAVADVEGFFEVLIETDRPLPPDRLWHRVELELLEPRRPGYAPVTAAAEVLVPPPGARYGVISDIDDTVVFTDATHLVGMLRNVMLGNAHTRLPFPGVAALYRAFMHGADGPALNPLFYVSNSPWNFYDLLSQFFRLNDIPLGPVLFLRDWGLSTEGLFPLRQRAYKSEVIREIVDFYPRLPFILIGDSGEKDPEIYRDIVHQYPERILAVYIRNVSPGPDRVRAIRGLAEEIAEAGSSLVLADNTLPMAEHALGHGWILPAAVAEVEAEVAARSEELGRRTPPMRIRGRTVAETREAVEGDAGEEAIAGGEDQEASGLVLDRPADEEPKRGDRSSH